jgi:hypothetical protein
MPGFLVSIHRSSLPNRFNEAAFFQFIHKARIDKLLGLVSSGFGVAFADQIQ